MQKVIIWVVIFWAAVMAAMVLRSAVAEGSTLVFVTQTLPGGQAGAAYSVTIEATPTPAEAVSYNLVAGELPQGMALSPEGVLSGTPQQVGTYELTVRALTASNQTDQVLQLQVMSELEYPSGTLIKKIADPTVWHLENQRLQGFSTPTQFLSQGFKWSDIVEVTEAELVIYPVGSIVLIQSGTLVKQPDNPEVSLILDGKRYGFTDPATFLDLKYQWDGIYTALAGEPLGYEFAGIMERRPTHFPYTKIKVASSATVYLLESDENQNLLRRGIPSAGVFFSRGWQWPDIITITDEEMALYQDGDVLFYRDGTLLKGDQSGTVYVMEYGKKRPVLTGDDFEAMRYRWDNIITATQAECDTIEEGLPIAADPLKLQLLAERRAAEAAARRPFSSSYEAGTVATGAGNFAYKVVRAARGATQVYTLSNAQSDCVDNCPTGRALTTYVDQVGGFAAIHGSYFCPPDYAYCAGRGYSYDTPLFDSLAGRWFNWINRDWNDRAALTFNGNDAESYYAGKWTGNPDGTFNSWTDQRVSETGHEASIFNYPLLLHHGAIIASNDNTDDKQRTRGTRAAIGFNADTLFLAVISNATVVEAAHAMQALGATDALNLDGGGSTALFYQGSYKTGPGRLLPNAIVLKQRN